jgi:hypothetical protein
VSCSPSPQQPSSRGPPCRRPRPRTSGHLRLAGRPPRAAPTPAGPASVCRSWRSSRSKASAPQRWRGHPPGRHLRSWRGSRHARRCPLSGLRWSCGRGLDRPVRQGEVRASPPDAHGFAHETCREAPGRGGTGWNDLAASVLLSGPTASGIPPASTPPAQFRSRWVVTAYPMGEATAMSSSAASFGQRPRVARPTACPGRPGRGGAC